jgi:hypothetical protein
MHAAHARGKPIPFHAALLLLTAQRRGWSIGPAALNAYLVGLKPSNCAAGQEMEGPLYRDWRSGNPPHRPTRALETAVLRRI